MATFTAIRNKKQTAGAMLGVLSYVVQAKKTMLDGACLVTGSNCVPQASSLEMMTTIKHDYRPNKFVIHLHTPGAKRKPFFQKN